eukprot:5861942-Pyramimonas_sp.AAC.1
MPSSLHPSSGCVRLPRGSSRRVDERFDNWGEHSSRFTLAAHRPCPLPDLSAGTRSASHTGCGLDHQVPGPQVRHGWLQVRQTYTTRTMRGTAIWPYVFICTESYRFNLAARLLLSLDNLKCRAESKCVPVQNQCRCR